MALVTPTTQDLSDNIISELQSSLNQTIPLLPLSFNRVLAKVLAGLFIILYKYCGFIFQQMFVQTASNETTDINGIGLIPLQEWGDLIGIGLPVAATQANMFVEITVLAPGTLASGTQLIASANGVTYLTLTGVTLTTPSGSIASVADNGDTFSRFTTAAPHGLTTGQTITHAGFSESTYNGTFQVLVIDTTNYDIIAISFVATGTGTFTSLTVTVEVFAASDQQGGDGSGIIGNLILGQTMDFVNPLAQVSQSTTVIEITAIGANEEATEVYRQRIIDRFKAIPQGGAYVDYHDWATEVAGIINAYVFTSTEPGEVDVFCESTTAIDPDGIPPGSLLDTVDDSIQFDLNGLATRRPANALAQALAITRTGFDVTVDGIANVDDVPTVETEITTAVTQYFLNAEPFIRGLTVGDRTDILTQTAIIGIVEDVVSAAQGIFTDATFERTAGGGVIPSYQLGNEVASPNKGEKSKLVNIVFT